MEDPPASDHRAALPSGRRIVAFSSIAGALTVFGQTAGISVFIDSLIADVGVSRADISTVYSASSLVAAFAMPWVGRRIDQHGSRRVTLIVAVLFGAAIMAMSQVGTLVGLVLGFFALRLLGQGALNLVSKVIVALRFRATLGRAVAVSGALTAVGLSLLPILLSAAIESIGWRETWFVSGIAVLAVVIPLTLWAIPRGADLAMASRPHATDAPADDWTRAYAVRTGMFWAITLTVAANALVFTGLAFHQISILGEVGLSPTRAAANFLPQTIASVGGLSLTGVLAHRVPGRAMLALSMALLALATLTLLFLEDTWITIVYALLLGSAAGIGFASEGVLYPRYFGVKAIASIRGLAFTVSVAAAAAGPIIVGVSFQATGTYAVAAVVMAMIPIAVGLLILVVRAPTSPPGP
ncbi:MAG TPA: MFS transporter [Candidatus Limnocylindria bacterium]|nr:MFS transporter [Candidatus Limnocylindria bacterium]